MAGSKCLFPLIFGHDRKEEGGGMPRDTVRLSLKEWEDDSAPGAGSG